MMKTLLFVALTIVACAHPVQAQEKGGASQDMIILRPEALSGKAGAAKGKAAVDPVVEKLNTIILPEVNIRDLPLDRIIGQLAAVSRVYDKSGQGLNLILIDPDRKNPVVNIALRNISVGKLLEIITMQVGFTYEIRNGVIEVRPDTGPKDLETAFFPLAPALMVRLATLGGATNPLPSRKPAKGDDSPLPEEIALRIFFIRAGVPFDTTAGSGLAYDGTFLIVSHNRKSLEQIRDILRRFNSGK